MLVVVVVGDEHVDLAGDRRNSAAMPSILVSSRSFRPLTVWISDRTL